jgi:hypothetical protein
VKIRGLLLWVLGRLKMQFQINGQDYYLKFVEDENRLYVFRATAEGIERFPVYDDASRQEWTERRKSGSKLIQ